MARSRLPRARPLRANPLLRGGHGVCDVLVLRGHATYVVEGIEEVGEARGRQDEREGFGLLLLVQTHQPLAQPRDGDAVLAAQQLQTLRLQPEQQVEAAQALAPKAELA